MPRYIRRYLETSVQTDLKRKMVFLGGARQCGKTTLARRLLENAKLPDPKQRYLNWDSADDRESIMAERFPSGKGLLILDEVHKYAHWRQAIKGLFDKRGHEVRILVTGSARLDYYRHGGDSLQGRYHYYRMHPFTFAETGGESRGDLQHLMVCSGFPEPFRLGSERETRRWSREYHSRLIRDDLRDLELVREISLLEKLSLALPDRVGSPLSLNSLREDLQVAHQTVARWLDMLENLYMLFRLAPFGAPLLRAVKKETKLYFTDWTRVKQESLRFENLVACHLLKWCHFQQDTAGREVDLRYFRDVDGREVDFVVTEDGKPLSFIECKSADRETSRALRYLKERFPQAEAWQISLEGRRDDIDTQGIRQSSAVVFLKTLL
jgi:uncharacterized protein